MTSLGGALAQKRGLRGETPSEDKAASSPPHPSETAARPCSRQPPIIYDQTQACRAASRSSPSPHSAGRQPRTRSPPTPDRARPASAASAATAAAAAAMRSAPGAARSTTTATAAASGATVEASVLSGCRLASCRARLRVGYRERPSGRGRLPVARMNVVRWLPLPCPASSLALSAEAACCPSGLPSF